MIPKIDDGLIYNSPEAQAWKLAMFGNNRFFAFCISYRGIDEILPEWELASGLAFLESPPDRDWKMQIHYPEMGIQGGWTDNVWMWG